MPLRYCKLSHSLHYYNVHSFSNDTELEVLAVTRCAALIRVLMCFLKSFQVVFEGVSSGGKSDIKR